MEASLDQYSDRRYADTPTRRHALTSFAAGVYGLEKRRVKMYIPGYSMSADFPYRTRRTIKPVLMDSSREIAHDLLVEILEDAHWAPTHGLTQPWRFHVFTHEARTRLAGALQTIYDQITSVAETRPEKRAKLRDNCLQAHAVVAVAAHSEAGGKISRLDELCSTACAVQNLLLSAHQRGLGSFWATPPVACSQEFTAWLGLDSAHCSLGLVFLGYAKDSPAPSVRVPLEERITFHRT